MAGGVAGGACEDPLVSRRAVSSALAGASVAVLTGLLFVVHVPYAILSPGPVCNTVGPGNSTCPAVGAKQLITISPASADHPSRSRLGFTTVSVRDGEPSVAEALGAWLTSSEAVVPEEVIRPPGQSQQQVDRQNRQDMRKAQDSAVEAADAAVYGVRVAKIQPGYPAAGVLQVGDVVQAVDGAQVYSAAGVVAATASTDPQRRYQLRILRAGVPRDVSLGRRPSTDASGRLVFGVSLEAAPAPARAQITLDPAVIGGPSAGLMFALGVYDRLTGVQLTGDAVVAGTGTIDASGQVGPIGGIQQKLYAARHAFAAQFFLAPAGDCADARAATPRGLQVIKVSTLDDALNALADIRSGRAGRLPSC